MALPRFARDVVTVLRAPTVTSHGTQVPDWSAAVGTDVSGCNFQPGVGAETYDRREAVEGAATVYMPPGTDVLGTDRIRYAGDVYEVHGRPLRWDSPTGRLSHCLVMLTIWEG